MQTNFKKTAQIDKIDDELKIKLVFFGIGVPHSV